MYTKPIYHNILGLDRDSSMCYTHPCHNEVTLITTLVNKGR